MESNSHTNSTEIGSKIEEESKTATPFVPEEKELTFDEVLDQLDILYTEKELLREEVSEKIKIAKEGHKEEVVALARKDGKVDIIREGLLWEEVRWLKTETEAWNFLKEKYPHVFEADEKVALKANEINALVQKYFGIQGGEVITPYSIIKLVSKIADWKLKKLIKENGIGN